MGGYTWATMPLPNHGEATHIPQEVGIFNHPATRSVSEFHFKLELDREMQDPNALYWVMQRMGIFIVSLEEDRYIPQEWLARPTQHAVSGFDWAPGLDRSGWHWATLIMAIPMHVVGGPATAAALLREAHSWQYQGQFLRVNIHDSKGDLFSCTITCLQVEEWAKKESTVRRNRREREEAKRRASESRGRLRVTIQPLEGMPLLTLDDANSIAQHYFPDATTPFRPSTKIGGVVVEGMGTLDWGFFAKEHLVGKWPVRLRHPDGNPHHYYYYQLQSDYTKSHSLCFMCHQPRRIDCMKSCKEAAMRERLKKQYHLRLAMPSKRSISYSQILSEDPTMLTALHSAQQMHATKVWKWR